MLDQDDFDRSFSSPPPTPSGTHGGPMKAVYTIVERPGGKRFWVRIGAAFTNRDGSLNVKLDALPLDRTLQVRDPFPPRPNGGRISDDGEPDPPARM